MPRLLGLSLLTLLSLSGCLLDQDRYPPAVPVARPWDNSTPFMLQPHTRADLFQSQTCPTPEPTVTRASVGPAPRDWDSWTTLKQVCTGKGKKRTCQYVSASAVETANAVALVKPSRQHALTQGGLFRYKILPGVRQIFQVEVAMHSPSFLELPTGERLAIGMALDETAWAAAREYVGEGPNREEIIAIYAHSIPQEASTTLYFKSGLKIPLKLVATDTTNPMTVSWDIPRAPKGLPEIPVAERPPKIDLARIHSGYTIASTGKYPPPWLPVEVFDDGARTFIRFAEPLTHLRGPAVFGLNQKGKVELVQSHMFVRGQDAMLVVQGIRPAYELQDSAAMKVTITRTAPAVAVATGGVYAH